MPVSEQHKEEQDTNIDEPQPSLEQLIAQQAVSPISNLDEFRHFGLQMMIPIC
jgi:hypothetical protein